MINSLKGIISFANDLQICIDVQGVEYVLIVSQSCVDKYSKHIGEEEKILTYLHITDRSMELFGFNSIAERALFLSLKKVDGIGPKAAIKILSHTTPKNFLNILHSHDNKALSSLPGIGSKTANKILVTLENVFVPSKRSAVVKEEPSMTSKACSDILLALIAMGYDKESAREQLEKVVNEHSYANDEDIAKNEGKILQEIIVKLV